MTEQETGAASDKPQWPKQKLTSEQNVRRLQARIVKAQEAGHFNKAKSLQRILAHSHSAKIVAVERVTTNDGCKTPGVDGAT